MLSACARARRLTIVAVVLLWALVPSLSHAQTTGDFAADFVLGQGEFTTNTVNFGGLAATDFPAGVAVDATGHVYLADNFNSRVLGWKSIAGLKNGAPADLVIGQPDAFSSLCISDGANFPPSAASLCLPQGLAVDGSGNLYAADSHNNRVLEYSQPFNSGFSAGQPANLVFRQSGSFTSGEPHFSGDGLNEPQGIAIDPAGNLYVADAFNGRVLEYNTPLSRTAAAGSGDTSLDLVFQDNGLVAPAAGLALDPAYNLLIADQENNRLLEYNTPLYRTHARGSGDAVADLVLGQPDFTHNMLNSGGPRGRGLNTPDSVAIDAAGHLYVADSSNNRVLGWRKAASLTNGAPADIVIGQPDFYSNACATSRVGLCLLSPDGAAAASALAVDSADNLYVADTNNERVLEYNQPFNRKQMLSTEISVGQPANLVFGQNGSFVTNNCNLGTDQASAGSLCYPQGLAVDSAGNLFIADTVNNRVLEYDAPLKRTGVGSLGNYAIADNVFGQQDFTTGHPHGSDCAGRPSASNLCYPVGVAVDSAGNVYISDLYNSRVLEYNSPLVATGDPTSGDAIADVVFGQGGSFATNTISCSGITGDSPTSADGLCEPGGVAVDSAGNVYIADPLNNRVLEYDRPLANPSAPNTTANRVFGQASFAGYACAGGSPNSTPPPFTTIAGGLCDPQGIAVDAGANLWIADTLNNRGLKFSNPVAATKAMR